MTCSFSFFYGANNLHLIEIYIEIAEILKNLFVSSQALMKVKGTKFHYLQHLTIDLKTTSFSVSSALRYSIAEIIF